MSAVYANAQTKQLFQTRKIMWFREEKHFTPYLVLITQCYHLGEFVHAEAVCIKNTAVQITKELVEQTWTRVGNQNPPVNQQIVPVIGNSVKTSLDKKTNPNLANFQARLKTALLIYTNCFPG